MIESIDMDEVESQRLHLVAHMIKQKQDKTIPFSFPFE